MAARMCDGEKFVLLNATVRKGGQELRRPLLMPGMELRQLSLCEEGGCESVMSSSLFCGCIGCDIAQFAD